MAELTTIGEAMAVFASLEPDVSLIEATEFRKYLAGAELNVAIGVSRLGHSVSYITQVGKDPIGKFIVKELQRADIAVDNISYSDKHKTGLMLKQNVTNGDPDTANFRQNSAAANFDSTQVTNVHLANTKIVHLTGIFAALSDKTYQATEALLSKCRQITDLTIVFDTNLRPALWSSVTKMVDLTNRLAAQATIVLPGVNEGEILMGSNDPDDIADFYLNQSTITQLVVVKVGAKGAYYKNKAGESGFVPGFAVQKVVDTVGAGDGFAVGIITGLLEKQPLQEIVRRANAVGALAVQSAGDNTGYPTRDELNEFLRKTDPKKIVQTVN